MEGGGKHPRVLHQPKKPGADSVKPSLHIVVTIGEHSSDVALKRILRLSTHELQIFLVNYEYL